MRIPLEWLAEKFATELDRSAIATALFESGFELESLDWIRPGLETVVTGRILTCESHPNADRLRICSVDVAEARSHGGSSTPKGASAAEADSSLLTIVTAAPNVQAGDIVPVALVGSRLPTGKEIGLGKLRGVESYGMFCSATELGMALEAPGDASRLEAMEVKKAAARGVVLDAAARVRAREDAFEFVLVLPTDTPIGRPIADILELGDCVLEVAITANRGDGLSVTGLARALAAAGLGQLALAGGALGGGSVAGTPLPEVKLNAALEAPDLCPRYTARIVSGLAVGPSPEWMSRRLELAGIRSLNNVIDAMNYVMLDVGQPLHAFDLARIDAATISARRARPLERLTTLDGSVRDLPPDTLVIADARGPLAVAGVMGGLGSSVSAATTSVMVESAYFLPGAIRRSARTLGLNSESSYRFERGVDPEATVEALERACDLLIQVAGGQRLGAAIDVRRQGFPEPLVVPLRPERTDRILGASVSADDQARMLASLGFSEAQAGPDAAASGRSEIYRDARWFTVPGWRRHDVTREIDLIEEIAQRIGYGAILDTLPPLATLPDARPPVSDRLRELLRGLGFWEVLTNSVVPAASQQSFVSGPDELVKLARPMGDLQVMRASLLPSLLEVARTNLNRGASRALIYDVGRVYVQGESSRTELLQATALAIGAVADGMWKHAPEAYDADFFWAKGVATGVLGALGLVDLEARQEGAVPGLHPGRAASLVLDGLVLVTFGELHPALVEPYDLPTGKRAAVVIFHPDAVAECLARRESRGFVPFSRFPAVERDVAIVLDQGIVAGEVVASARQAGGALLERVRVFDRYAGPQVPAGKVSLALNLRYRAPDRTLTDSEVDPVHAGILDHLCRQHDATLRV